MNIISTSGLSKSYGKIRALDNVTLEIPEGAVGLLGPNGAGKSTLLKILLNLVQPTGGSLSILGDKVTAKNFNILEKIGYMPEHECLDPTKTAISFVTQMAMINGLPRSDAKQRAHEALHYVEIADERYRKIKSYSTGMRQKVKLAQAIAHDPEIIFLDEPTNGMDPDSRRQIMNLIRDLHQNHGKSIILSSHILADVEAVCDHVIVVNLGKVVLQGDLKELAGGHRDTLDVKVGVDPKIFEKLLKKEKFKFETSGPVFHIERKENTLDRIVDICAEKDIPLRYANQQMLSLEDIFLDIIKKTSGPAAAYESKGGKTLAN